MIKLAFGLTPDDEWSIDWRMVRHSNPRSTSYQLVFTNKTKQESEELVLHVSPKQFQEMMRRGQIFIDQGKEITVLKQTQNNEGEELNFLGDFTLEDLLANHSSDSVPDATDTIGEIAQIEHKETLDWWRGLLPEEKGALLGLYREMCADHPTLYEAQYGPIESGQIPLEWLVLQKARLQKE